MSPSLHLFEAFGIELEYMLVKRDTMDVYPVVDAIFKSASGDYISDYEDGTITWSNELVRHVMEVKVTNPVVSLADLEFDFQKSLHKINALAEFENARLLPTAMHPWMNPLVETQLWPHEYADVYQTFHRIFDCHRHGWANVQSVHLNLPFSGDDEFAHLHAAIRLVLPLIPALAASSPVMDGNVNGILDNRLDVYCRNSRLISQITGDIIPEPVYSQNEYDEQILQPMYKAIAPHDHTGALQNEFLNARGAIARFDRSAIEIRLIDVQECPVADLAIVQAVVHAIRKLVSEQTCTWKTQADWPTKRLLALLKDTIRTAETTLVSDEEYLQLWGIHDRDNCSMHALWHHILSDVRPDTKPIGRALEHILNNGVLARRIVSRLPDKPGHKDLHILYSSLADCLNNGRMLV